jgi:hypothetical protein
VEGRLAKKIDVPGGGAGAAASSERLFLFSSGEDIAGEAAIVIPGGKKLEHVGVKVELKGVIGES